nr:hypothetical protein CFP56_21893 [Quercus suber]
MHNTTGVGSTVCDYGRLFGRRDPFIITAAEGIVVDDSSHTYDKAEVEVQGPFRFSINRSRMRDMALRVPGPLYCAYSTLAFKISFPLAEIDPRRTVCGRTHTVDRLLPVPPEHPPVVMKRTREIASFFTKASTNRSECDLRAADLVGGDVITVPNQGAYSYTVYAGAEASTVVQCRLKSLALSLETVHLASCIYGSLVPEVHLKGQIGEDEPGKEVLLIYVMPRMKGISWLDHVIAYDLPNDAPDICAKRLTLVTDVAHFFALSGKSPQTLEQAQSLVLQQSYENDLRRLLHALPQRFHSTIQDCLEALPSIMALPMVLAHQDFGYANIMVDPTTCHLLGVLDWAEAKVEPFGFNLWSLEHLTGHFHLRRGWEPYVDYDVLHDVFWKTLREEIGVHDDGILRTVKLAMIMNLLLVRGFTSRLANSSEPEPISDDASGAYNMLHLDGLLVNPQTKFI